MTSLQLGCYDTSIISCHAKSWLSGEEMTWNESIYLWEIAMVDEMMMTTQVRHPKQNIVNN